ncbi:TetR/AcrR family transcriptional regulator [Amycolatopsis sp. QT-25]|uniref:TetR/AcrR family transcriptional regulator n=1 Tax=Amycolatopsis sp. QT-25 TaxID=3034022 RepID=UPI0023ED5079|nr:TetR/AcrR family transcriptional regulator [Amycolatopsis sp. QT-25]WET76717.1 TetR/AcrR family transcriptional regulator [Amycolatopsis sp. QT-25]
MARTKPGEQRRAELLDSAEAVVLRSGIDALTVDEVALGAGVAKGTFYLHFANKEELLGALRDRYVTRLVERQDRAVRDAHGFERVERWIRAGIDEYLNDVRLHDVLFHYPARVDPVPNTAVDALRDALVASGFGLPDPEATAVVLYHVMHGVADRIAHIPADRERLLAEITRICRLLLGAAAAG